MSYETLMITYLFYMVFLIFALGCEKQSTSLKLPTSLHALPDAEANGLIVENRTYQFEHFPNPYHPSIVELPLGGYLMSFQYDFNTSAPNKQQHTALVELDSDFHPTHTPYSLDQNNLRIENMRLFRIGSSIWSTFNSHVPIHPMEQKTPVISVFLSQLSKLTGHFEIEWRTTYLPMYWQFSAVEHNWVPFTVQNAQTWRDVRFSYSLSPHIVFQMKNTAGDIELSPLCHQTLPEGFGIIKGGTPAIALTEKEAIAFYHASQDDPQTGMDLYSFGAYIFQRTPPHCITRISKEPIRYHGLYETPFSSTSSSKAGEILPLGLIKILYKNEPTYVVSLGENKSSARVILVNETKLLESLVEVQQPQSTP